MLNTDEIKGKREKPRIDSREDAPLDVEMPCGGSVQDYSTIIEIKEQKHNHDVEDFKNEIAVVLLVGCLLLAVNFGLIDAIWHIDAPMFTSSFEVVKMVSTTVLGYLFGSRFKS